MNKFCFEFNSILGLIFPFQMLDALKPYADMMVWHFKDPAKAFKGFLDDAMQIAYQQRIDHLKPFVQPDKM